MSARFPHWTPEDLRRPHLGVALAFELLARRLFEQTLKDEAVRMPKDHARRFFLEVKQVEALGQTAVIVVNHGVPGGPGRNQRAHRRPSLVGRVRCRRRRR
jgi:hypothetical protein